MQARKKVLSLFCRLNAKSLAGFLALTCLTSLALTGNVFASTYSLNVSSSGAQSISIAGVGNGAAISADNITVSTTCRYGYNFTISTSVNNNNLYLGGDSSNNTSGTYFTPADGTTTLANSTNTWGYYYNNAAPTTAPTTSNIFNAVPALGSTAASIKTPLSSPAAADISDSFNIYYGVSASAGLATGTYKMIPDTDNSNNDGTIIYYATMADACSQYTVNFSPTSVFEGNTLSGTGTMNDQTIYEGVATQLTANGFTAPSGYYFAGWNTQDDGSGTQYTNSQQVTDLVSVGSTITLYAMWTDCPGGYICYSDNDQYDYPATLPCIVGEMGNQPISNTATSATLYAPNYKCDGSGFVSWNTNPYGFGTDYGPNQTIEFTAGQYSNAGLKLYANWYGSEDEMQNWTGCSSMSIGDVTALTDNRDNNVYAIAKLADGKCWMIENLRLADKDSSNNDINLDSTNTHNPSLPLTNIYDSGTTSNHLSPTSSLAYDSNTAPEGWCKDDSTACDDQSRLRTDNTVLFANNTSSSYSALSNVYSYGNYYNWYSATAGHGKYGSSYGNGYHAPGDICPAGWHLPKGGNKSQESTNEFWSLVVTGINNGVNPANYNSSEPYYTGNPEGSNVSKALRAYPNNFIYSGYALEPSISYRNSSGQYLSATGAGTNNYRLFLISSTTVRPGTGSVSRHYGDTVRCVAGV